MLPHCQGLTGAVFIGCEEENRPRPQEIMLSMALF